MSRFYQTVTTNTLIYFDLIFPCFISLRLHRFILALDYSLVKKHQSLGKLFTRNFLSRGISSNGRAPALHAGGTGIDTQILHFYFRC